MIFDMLFDREFDMIYMLFDIAFKMEFAMIYVMTISINIMRGQYILGLSIPTENSCILLFLPLRNLIIYFIKSEFN